MDFSDYDLAVLKDDPSMLYSMADGLLREMAAAFNYNPLVSPTEEDLSSLVHEIGPHKELQKNIQHVKDVLGGPDTARQICIKWMERSGVLKALSGSFVNPGAGMPEGISFDAVIIRDGVANWMLRRLMLALRLDPKTVNRVVLAMGDRLMGSVEHQLVASFIERTGAGPFVGEFAEIFMVPALKAAGFTHIVNPPWLTSDGDEVCDAVFGNLPELLRGTVLVVGNAPNTIQAAGQLRAAARRVDPSFDADDPQLFMMGDFFPLAYNDEPSATHQNPISGIGQIVRNALFLYRAVM